MSRRAISLQLSVAAKMPDGRAASMVHARNGYAITKCEDGAFRIDLDTEAAGRHATENPTAPRPDVVEIGAAFVIQANYAPEGFTPSKK